MTDGVAYNLEPILPQAFLGRSWDYASDAVGGCGIHFGAKVSDDGSLSGPDSVIDDEIEISRGDGRYHQNLLKRMFKVRNSKPSNRKVAMPKSIRRQVD